MNPIKDRMNSATIRKFLGHRKGTRLVKITGPKNSAGNPTS